jgi:hypothetical protein
MKLIDNPRGNYRFLTGIAPYSSGVVAMPGYEIVYIILHEPLPYRQGFDLIERYLSAEGRPRHALCAIALRSPRPFTFDGFAEFNAGYRSVLESWDIPVDGHNPIARTNVAPAIRPPAEPSLYAFAYTAPCSDPRPPVTFVVAGAGELSSSVLSPASIVRAGDTSPDAMRAKATQVMRTMQGRLDGLRVTWSDVTTVDIYTIHPLHTFLETGILVKMGPAALHGVHWSYSRPPIVDIEFEMDVRGICQEKRLEIGD